MLDITWKIFSQTGNIETYLLMKEIERADQEPTVIDEREELATLDTPLS